MNEKQRNFISFRQIGLIYLLLFLLLSACKKSETTESYDILNFSDETTKAAELVTDANEDLNKIKVMYKKSEDQQEELKSAMNSKDVAKVQKITDDLVYVINDGTTLGENALEKIEQAEAMNVNADFKEYLSLKADSLRKQLQAFEERRQSAKLIRDLFGTTDPQVVEKSKLGIKEKDENFQKIIKEAEDLNKQANDLAKSVSRKTS